MIHWFLYSVGVRGSPWESVDSVGVRGCPWGSPWDSVGVRGSPWGGGAKFDVSCLFIDFLVFACFGLFFVRFLWICSFLWFLPLSVIVSYVFVYS